MRIKPSSSFPHPVLSEGTGDYDDRHFRLELEVSEADDGTAAMLSGSMMLDDSFLHSWLSTDRAIWGLMLTCRDTYLDKFWPMTSDEVSIDLSGGIVRGSVYVRGVVIATQDGLTVNSDAIDKEFPEAARSVNTGDVLALTEELCFEAGLEKLAPLESIFKLVKQEGLPESTFQVDLEEESIQIFAAPELHDFLDQLRGRTDLSDILLSALYLPVVMQVLDGLRGDSAYADRRWHVVISARCRAEGIDIDRADLAEAAQKLLDSPLGSLEKIMRGMDR